MRPRPQYLGPQAPFTCLPVPLTSLLDYSEEDDSEAMFEVSAFAEMFVEMMQVGGVPARPMPMCVCKG